MAARITATAVLAAAALLSAACPGNDKIKINQPDTLDVVVSGAVFDEANNPLAGVTITVVGQTTTSTTTDASGRFTAADVTVRAGDLVLGAASKADYTTSTRFARPVGNTVEMNFVLTSVTPLPIDGSVTATLYPTDPGGYVGEPYESESAWNMRRFSFTTGAEGLSVELSWDHVANATLKMWAIEGSLTSQDVGGRQVIALPPNTTAILVVGEPVKVVTQPVSFTLTTHRVGG